MKLFKNLEELPSFSNPVVTIGAFDGVHSGHQKIINKIKELAKQVQGESVVITFDPHPRHFLFPDDDKLQLISTIDEKVALLEQLGIDNMVVVPFNETFANQSPEAYIENFLLEKFKPTYVVIGYDHRFGKDRAGNIDLLKKYEKENDFSLIEIDKKEVDDIAVSSTKIRKAINDGQVEKANKFLQHCFTLGGKVIHGQKLGHSLGYPTANLAVENKFKLIPPDGIYAVYVLHKQKRYQAMLYIGKRPTLKNLEQKTIEVNIFDFNKEIYHEELQLQFVNKIREDQEFSSLEELKTQIGQDKIEALNVFQKLEGKEANENYTQAKKKTSVSVVILNFNGEEFLEKYLPFLQECTYSNFKIIVADNASTDGSIDLLQNKYPEVTIHRLVENHGFAKGYNEALGSIDGELFILLNSDVEVTKGWIEPLVELMDSNPNIAACQPKVLDLKARNKFEFAGAAGGWIDKYGYPFCRGRLFNEIETDEGQYDQQVEIFWATGASLVVRAELFKKIGGFDAAYWAHHEEIDLCWRLKRAGYKIMACPQSVVYHLGGGSLNYGNPRKTFLNFRNSLYSIHKNVPKNKRFQIIGTRLFLDVIAGLFFLVKGEFSSFISLIKADWTYLRNRNILEQKRKSYQEKINKISISIKVNETGIYNGSIVWAYFIKGKRTFKNLFSKS